MLSSSLLAWQGFHKLSQAPLHYRKMEVSVSGKQFVFPRECACCGAYPLVTLPVIGGEKNQRSRTRSWVFEVPYCVACRTHVRRVEVLLVFGLILLAISVEGGLFGTVLLGTIANGISITAASLASSGAAVLILYQLLRRTRSANCARLTRSVFYLGANGPCHSFDIRSPFYFAEFVRANHRKLVNASPRVVGVLKGTRFGDFQVPRRILRRHR